VPDNADYGGHPDEELEHPTGSEESPVYRMVSHDDGWATQLYFIVCHEGWRESIVCERMYGWAAEWLIEVLQSRPFAPGRDAIAESYVPPPNGSSLEDNRP
jgi:hypothetical protein